MHYVKPTVKDLNGRVASGNSVNACMAGTTVTGGACTTGGGDSSCYSGTSGSGGVDCINGSAVTDSCLPGSAAGWECTTGGGPRYAGTMCSTGSAA